jgi:hypothetical protein
MKTIKTEVTLYIHRTAKGEENVDLADMSEYSWGGMLIGTHTVEIEVPIPEPDFAEIAKKFDDKISAVRADAEMKIEAIESEKQKYFALEVDNEQ